MFQFLGRNSGRSDCAVVNGAVYTARVSIPRSEFWSFGPRGNRALARSARRFQFLGRNSGRSDSKNLYTLHFYAEVSIPRSEFWSFGRAGLQRAGAGHVVSIPRSEFWSFGLAARLPIGSQLFGFQFLGRNSGRSDTKDFVAGRL